MSPSARTSSALLPGVHVAVDCGRAFEGSAVVFTSLDGYRLLRVAALPAQASPSAAAEGGRAAADDSTTPVTFPGARVIEERPVPVLAEEDGLPSAAGKHSRVRVSPRIAACTRLVDDHFPAPYATSDAVGDAASPAAALRALRVLVDPRDRRLGIMLASVVAAAAPRCGIDRPATESKPSAAAVNGHARSKKNTAGGKSGCDGNDDSTGEAGGHHEDHAAHAEDDLQDD